MPGVRASSRDGDKGRMSESERRHRVKEGRGKKDGGVGGSQGVCFWGERARESRFTVLQD